MPTTLNPTGAPSLFGGIGRLEFSQGNPDDPFPVWTDITLYVRTEDEPLRITARGRQSELDQVQPSQLTCMLDNTDNRFTFGLTSGPYGANWAPAKKVRYSETIGQRTFVLYTGWIKFPDIDDWRPIGQQYVNLTCTDRLARLSRGKQFVSTLAAHVVNKARNGALKGYWPMAADTLSFPDITGQQPPLTPDQTVAPSLVAPSFNDMVVAPGDDLATLVTGYDPVNGLNGTSLLSRLGGGAGIPLAAGQVLTLIAWLSPAFPDMTNTIALSQAAPFWLDVTEVPATSNANIAWVAGLFPDARWAPGALGTNLHWSSIATFPIVSNGWALPVMIQYGYSPTVQQLYYGGTSLAPLNLFGSAPTSMTLTTMHTPMRSWAGGIAHVQLYVGAPGDFTVTDYLAQIQVGMLGLEYQTTGQRINTLLDYAGVPANDRAIDPGVSYMQKARLAGLDPLTAIQDAVSTERGRGFAAGDGRYTFHDRVRVLNV